MTEVLSQYDENEALTHLGFPNLELPIGTTLNWLRLKTDNWPQLIKAIDNNLKQGGIAVACQNGIWRSRVLPFNMIGSHGNRIVNFIPQDLLGSISEGYTTLGLLNLLEKYAFVSPSHQPMLPVVHKRGGINDYALPSLDATNNPEFFIPVTNIVLTLDLFEAVEADLTLRLLRTISTFSSTLNLSIQIVDWPEDLYFKQYRSDNS